LSAVASQIPRATVDAKLIGLLAKSVVFLGVFRTSWFWPL
jgi:hypothetical protein